MSDSMIVATYTYETYVAERVPACGGMDSVPAGRNLRKEHTRTIVVPKSAADLWILHDIASQGNLIGEVDKREISVTYPAPQYWGVAE